MQLVSTFYRCWREKGEGEGGRQWRGGWESGRKEREGMGVGNPAGNREAKIWAKNSQNVLPSYSIKVQLPGPHDARHVATCLASPLLALHALTLPNNITFATTTWTKMIIVLYQQSLNQNNDTSTFRTWLHKWHSWNNKTLFSCLACVLLSHLNV